MYFKKYKNGLCLIYLLVKQINNFYILPFDSILIKDVLLNENLSFYDYLFQNELYTNLSIGTPSQNVKSIITFESKGFYIYQEAFNYSLSSTAKKYYWQFNKYFFNSMSYMITDHFYFNYYNKNLTNNIFKTNEALFIIISNKKEKKKYFNYGFIGLAYEDKKVYESPETTIEFINTAKKILNLKNKEFYFDFNKDNYTYKNFFNNYHKGNLIIGNHLNVEEKYEKNKVNYTYFLRDRNSLKMIINFDCIYSQINSLYPENNNFTKFNSVQLGIELRANLPYLIGTNDYLDYINKTFFGELINKNICYFNINNSTTNTKNLNSFICNGKSDDLINTLKYKFPELIFESKDLGKNFSLNINDLFSFNNFNKSDYNLYFLIFFHNKKTTENKNWVLGIPFFKKYKMIFDYENKRIGYYLETKIYKLDNKKETFISNNLFTILFVIIFIVIIFIFGMKFQKKIMKIPRKNKVNELDELYEYSSSPKINANNKDINQNRKNFNKNVELAIKILG